MQAAAPKSVHPPVKTSFDNTMESSTTVNSASDRTNLTGYGAPPTTPMPADQERSRLPAFVQRPPEPPHRPSRAPAEEQGPNYEVVPEQYELPGQAVKSNRKLEEPHRSSPLSGHMTAKESPTNPPRNARNTQPHAPMPPSRPSKSSLLEPVHDASEKVNQYELPQPLNAVVAPAPEPRMESFGFSEDDIRAMSPAPLVSRISTPTGDDRLNLARDSPVGHSNTRPQSTSPTPGASRPTRTKVIGTLPSDQQPVEPSPLATVHEGNEGALQRKDSVKSQYGFEGESPNVAQKATPSPFTRKPPVEGPHPPSRPSKSSTTPSLLYEMPLSNSIVVPQETPPPPLRTSQPDTMEPSYYDEINELASSMPKAAAYKSIADIKQQQKQQQRSSQEDLSGDGVAPAPPVRPSKSTPVTLEAWEKLPTEVADPSLALTPIIPPMPRAPQRVSSIHSDEMIEAAKQQLANHFKHHDSSSPATPNTVTIKSWQESRGSSMGPAPEFIPAVHGLMIHTALQYHLEIGTGPPGVSIEFLHMFLQEHQHIYGFEYALTTRDVCERIIKPLTVNQQCAYFELYNRRRDNNGKPLIGVANVYVSHAWSCKFIEPIDVMEEHAKENPNTYFWLDLFVVSQHTSAVTPQWLVSSLRANIKTIGTVLAVMSPWDNPLPIKRTWCLWEMMTALSQEGAKLIMRMPTDQRLLLKDGMQSSDTNLVMSTIAEMSVDSSESTVGTDRIALFSAIANSFGFKNVDQRIKEQLREWYGTSIKEVSAHAFSRGTTQAEGNLLVHVGTLLQELNLLQDALRYYEKSARVFSDCMGQRHESTAISYGRIGDLYVLLQDFHKAIEYHEKALEIIVTTLGAAHFTTSQSYNNIANVYLSKGEHEKAIHFYQKSLKIKLDLLGVNQSTTASAYSNVGNAYFCKGDNEKALKYLRKALDIFRATVGPKHSSATNCISTIGSVHLSKGEYDKALAYFTEALEIRQETRGANHPSVAQSFISIAEVYDQKKKYKQAVENAASVCLLSFCACLL